MVEARVAKVPGLQLLLPKTFQRIGKLLDALTNPHLNPSYRMTLFWVFSNLKESFKNPFKGSGQGRCQSNRSNIEVDCSRNDQELLRGCVFRV